MPDPAPVVGEEFDAYFVVSMKDEKEHAAKGDTCYEHAAVDIIRVRWDIRNGPTAIVSVSDMHANPESDANLKLEDGQSEVVGFVKTAELDVVDENSRWKTYEKDNWFPACSKINSRGCDALAATIEKKWDDWDEGKDVDFNGKTFTI